MDIHVFLLCYNESVLLPHTIKHYKKYLPSCKITIYDNESTDNSVEIAQNLGCTIVSWNSSNIQDETIQIQLRNKIWKQVQTGWIIIADMDEFICVTEQDLKTEQDNDTTILNIKGYEMIGESNSLNLDDIDLQEIKKYVDNYHESKHLCFLRQEITDMNYGPGSHTCNPQGTIIYSQHIYINKHMSYLGLPFIINKTIERYKRTEKMRNEKGYGRHYTSNVAEIEKRYTDILNSCKFI